MEYVCWGSSLYGIYPNKIHRKSSSVLGLRLVSVEMEVRKRTLDKLSVIRTEPIYAVLCRVQ